MLARGSFLRHYGTVLVLMVMAAAVKVVEAIDTSHHHHYQHPLNRLETMLERVDSSITDKRQRLAGDHVFHPIEPGWATNEVSLVEEETHPEDIQDYVNNAPWTRHSKHPHSVTIINMQMMKLVAANDQRVKTEGKCQVPQQRCNLIRSSKHSPGTVFQPRCALLHRCSEDTGCCSNDQVCAPAETENVELFFHAFENMRAKIEAMTFLNHTRCSCQSPKISPSCKCPGHYAPKSVGGKCICDCNVARSKCRRYKKGRRYFSSTDARCISTGECKHPTCEYGPFLTRQRRCTKRRERERYLTNRN